ncbi:MAG: flagellar hook-length control protein FliK [Candidatus Krumholzibacteria bacterium]|jgi:hypothetical protein|nr:flagellar hook-length control protein FliK [Candidatus Krumholzibacteria bacterium]
MFIETWLPADSIKTQLTTGVNLVNDVTTADKAPDFNDLLKLMIGGLPTAPAVAPVIDPSAAETVSSAGAKAAAMLPDMAPEVVQRREPGAPAIGYDTSGGLSALAHGAAPDGPIAATPEPAAAGSVWTPAVSTSGVPVAAAADRQTAPPVSPVLTAATEPFIAAASPGELFELAPADSRAGAPVIASLGDATTPAPKDSRPAAPVPATDANLPLPTLPGRPLAAPPSPSNAALEPTDSKPAPSPSPVDAPSQPARNEAKPALSPDQAPAAAVAREPAPVEPVFAQAQSRSAAAPAGAGAPPASGKLASRALRAELVAAVRSGLPQGDVEQATGGGAVRPAAGATGSPVQQVLRQISSPASGVGEVKRLSVQLEPEHLGRVEVRLTATANRLEVILQAESPAAAQALRDGAQELARTLGGKLDGRWQHVDVRIVEQAAGGRGADDADQADRDRSGGRDGRHDQSGRRRQHAGR